MYCHCGIRVKYGVTRDGKPAYSCSSGSCRFMATCPMHADGYRRYVPSPSSSTATNTLLVSFEATMHPVDKSAQMVVAQLFAPNAVLARLLLAEDESKDAVAPRREVDVARAVWRLLCGDVHPEFEAAYHTARDAFLYPMQAYNALLGHLTALQKAMPPPALLGAMGPPVPLQLFVEEIPAFFFRCIATMRQKEECHAQRVTSALSQRVDADDLVYRQLKPFQRAGVDFIISRGGRGMIADEMGLGKTIQAIAIAHHYRHEWPVLVVCPVSLMENWLKEFIQWCGVPASRIAVLQGAKARPGPIHCVVITSYSSLVNVVHVGGRGRVSSTSGRRRAGRPAASQETAESAAKGGGHGSHEDDDDDDDGTHNGDGVGNDELDDSGALGGGDSRARVKVAARPLHTRHGRKNLKVVDDAEGAPSSAWVPQPYKVVVLDESHYIKTPNSQRTKLALQICQTASRVVLLSGTPAMSRPSELYSQLQAIQSAGLPTRTQFSARYCNGFVSRFGVDVSGHSNLNELHVLLRHFIIRRTKLQVLDQLPSKTRQLLYLRVTDKEKKAMEKTVTALRRSLDEQQHRRQQATPPRSHGGADANGDGAAPTSSGSVLRAPNAFELKAATALAKIPAVTEYVKDLVEQYMDTGEKLLVFAHHQVMMEALQETVRRIRPTHPIDFIVISGDTPIAQREALADHFRRVATCQVAILSMQSSGTGHNFTCASTVIFTELDWNPSTHLQCEDRVHRIGQASTCIIKYLLADGTTDSVVWPLLQEKLSVTTAALDDLTGDSASKLTDGSAMQHVARTAAAASPGDASGGAKLQRTLESFLFTDKRGTKCDKVDGAVVSDEDDLGPSGARSCATPAPATRTRRSGQLSAPPGTDAEKPAAVVSIADMKALMKRKQLAGRGSDGSSSAVPQQQWHKPAPAASSRATSEHDRARQTRITDRSAGASAAVKATGPSTPVCCVDVDAVPLETATADRPSLNTSSSPNVTKAGAEAPDEVRRPSGRFHIGLPKPTVCAASTAVAAELVPSDSRGGDIESGRFPTVLSPASTGLAVKTVYRKTLFTVRAATATVGDSPVAAPAVLQSPPVVASVTEPPITLPSRVAEVSQYQARRTRFTITASAAASSSALDPTTDRTKRSREDE